jgi:ketosteroid isomerase-like protein
MNSNAQCATFGLLSLSVLFVAAEALVGVISLGAPSPTKKPCSASTYREFDFWVGDWEVFDIGSPSKVADAQVDAILDGCVLREDYRDTSGHKGQSFTIYDATRNVWHQTWVTNRGELLQIEGKLENGQMVLSGKNQQGSLVRGVWGPVNREVRETAVTSTDDGRTWQPWFDLVFRRTAHRVTKTDASAHENGRDDQEIVAGLDTQYQAAVKQNDAQTMDRMLADDFALVTGSGRTYTKADLLAEARSGRIHYERQDDTDQSVRVWGDAAVITARLVEKGTDDGQPFDKTVWFSDTYVRTPTGWRYVFGQSSLPLSEAPH